MFYLTTPTINMAAYTCAIGFDLGSSSSSSNKSPPPLLVIGGVSITGLEGVSFVGGVSTMSGSNVGGSLSLCWRSVVAMGGVSVAMGLSDVSWKMSSGIRWKRKDGCVTRPFFDYKFKMSLTFVLFLRLGNRFCSRWIFCQKIYRRILEFFLFAFKGLLRFFLEI